MQSPDYSVEFCGAAVSARYFYRAGFVFQVYDLEQGVWTEICCLLCGLAAGDPAVEELGVIHLLQQWVGLSQGLFPIPRVFSM